jgi:hypothetical protein
LNRNLKKDVIDSIRKLKPIIDPFRYVGRISSTNNDKEVTYDVEIRKE